MTDHERLTGQLGRAEQEVEQLQTLNMLLTEQIAAQDREINRLNKELLTFKFNVEHHRKFSAIEIHMTTEGDDLTEAVG